MGHSYKGGSVHAVPQAPLAAPVLRDSGSDTPAWTWSGTNPDTWDFWLWNGSTYDEDAQVAGTTRSFPGGYGPGSQIYIVGLDAIGNEITGHSNVIVMA